MTQGGGNTPLYALYKYVWPQRVGFFSRFGHKEGIDFGQFGLNRVWVLYCTVVLNWVMLFRRSYFFIIIDETIHKRPSKLMFRAPVSAATVLRASAHNYGPNNGTSRKIDFAHFLPIDWP